MGGHTDRVIVLVDMDCFYCQVEEKLNPELAGRPIAVVQYNAWRGGGLIAVNYPARDKGVTRHMRGDEAKEKCPDIELVKVPAVRGKADLTKYREGGKRVAEVLQTFTPLLQRASVDEAYLDITEPVRKRLSEMDREIVLDDVAHTYVVGCDTSDFINNIYHNEFSNDTNLKLLVGGMIVEEIRAAVYEKTGYRCSAGIAHNKILAKLVCGMNKPNKQTILPNDGIEELYKTLSVKKIKSLGGKFGNSLLEDLNIKYMGELAKFSEKELQKRYDDKTALFLYNIARGIDMEPVEVRLISKSIGCCKKFPGKTALTTVEDVTHWISELSEEMAERLEQDLQENNRKAKQIVLSFAQEINKKDIHSSRTQNLNSYDAKRISDEMFESLKKFAQKSDGSFRLKFLGLSAGKFEEITKVNITSFFKQMNKNDIKNESSTDTQTENKEINMEKENEQPKVKNGMMYFFTANESNKQDPFLSCKPKISKRKSSIMNFLTKGPKNVSNSSENHTSTNISETITEKTNQLNELNVNDIEIDAENSIEFPNITIKPISEDTYSDSTVEMDYNEQLANKIEFPGKFYENPEDECSLSPILDHGSRDTSRSFFMNYIKNMENSTESQKSLKYNENLYNENALKSMEQMKHSPEPCGSKEDATNTKCDIIKDSSIEENNLPIESVYSDNSNDENEVFYEYCPECNEKVFKAQLVSHLDHHMALKLMEEEKKIFKEELEKEKQKRQNQKEISPKITKPTKQQKRKQNQPDNKITIATFFKPSTKEIINAPCPECGKNIEPTDLDSHLDFHAAKKLHLELNPVKIGSKTVVINKKVDKNKKKALNNVQSVSNFFKPM